MLLQISFAFVELLELREILYLGDMVRDLVFRGYGIGITSLGYDDITSVETYRMLFSLLTIALTSKRFRRMIGSRTTSSEHFVVTGSLAATFYCLIGWSLLSQQ